MRMDLNGVFVRNLTCSAPPRPPTHAHTHTRTHTHTHDLGSDGSARLRPAPTAPRGSDGSARLRRLRAAPTAARGSARLRRLRRYRAAPTAPTATTAPAAPTGQRRPRSYRGRLVVRRPSSVVRRPHRLRRPSSVVSSLSRARTRVMSHINRARRSRHHATHHPTARGSLCTAADGVATADRGPALHPPHPPGRPRPCAKRLCRSFNRCGLLVACSGAET